jgi:selenocysteine-specific elongation factor
VQVHGQPAEAAVAGQRTALNLAAATTEDLSRGMTLGPVATFVTTRRADVRLSLLSSSTRSLKDRRRVHFHCNTMETVAEIVLHGAKQIPPGSESFARLKFPEATLLLPGDRFILRQFSPVVTIGGGVVLDAAPGHRLSDDHLLTVLAQNELDSVLRMRISRRGYLGISIPDLVAEAGATRQVIESQLLNDLRTGVLLRVGNLLMNAEHMAGLQTSMRKTVEDFHRGHPLERGIPKEELRKRLKSPDSVFDRALHGSVEEKQLEVLGDLVRLPGHGVVMRDEESESKKKIEEAFAATGLKVPALRDVISGLTVDKARAHKIVTLLLRDKVLVKISEELVFHRNALEDLRRQVAAYKTKTSKIDVGKFKELTGVSRKYAIPLLEYLDRERVTRRVGDAREIL